MNSFCVHTVGVFTKHTTSKYWNLREWPCNYPWRREEGWVITHHVSYLMARGFLTVMVVDLFFLLINKYWMHSLLAAVLIYILASQFLNKNFYAYSFLFRFSDLHVTGFFKKYEDPESNKEG